MCQNKCRGCEMKENNTEKDKDEERSISFYKTL